MIAYCLAPKPAAPGRAGNVRMKASATLCCWLVVGLSVAWAQTAERQLVVLGRNVACRAAPSLSGAVVARLDVADLVDLVASESGPPDWAPVVVGDGPTCFVSRRLVTPFPARTRSARHDPKVLIRDKPGSSGMTPGCDSRGRNDLRGSADIIVVQHF